MLFSFFIYVKFQAPLDMKITIFVNCTAYSMMLSGVVENKPYGKAALWCNFTVCCTSADGVRAGCLLDWKHLFWLHWWRCGQDCLKSLLYLLTHLKRAESLVRIEELLQKQKAAFIDKALSIFSVNSCRWYSKTVLEYTVYLEYRMNILYDKTAWKASNIILYSTQPH